MVIKYLFIFTTFITVVNIITSDSNCFQSNQNTYQQIPNNNTMYIRSGVNNKMASNNILNQTYNNRINGYTSIQSNQRGNITQQQPNRQYQMINNSINRIMENNNNIGAQYRQNQTYNNNVTSRYVRGPGTIPPMRRSMPQHNRQYHVMDSNINNTMLSSSNTMPQYNTNKIYNNVYNNNIASRYTSSPVGIQQPINSYQQQISNTQRYMAPAQYQQMYPQINNNRNNTIYR